MTTIIANVLSIFFIMGVGFAAGKTSVIPQSADKYFVSLLMNITMPCMVFGPYIFVGPGVWGTPQQAGKDIPFHCLQNRS